MTEKSILLLFGTSWPEKSLAFSPLAQWITYFDSFLRMESSKSLDFLAENTKKLRSTWISEPIFMRGSRRSWIKCDLSKIFKADCAGGVSFSWNIIDEISPKKTAT